MVGDGRSGAKWDKSKIEIMFWTTKRMGCVLVYSYTPCFVVVVAFIVSFS